GATIKTDEETGKIIIARIMHGGAADRSGLIHVGDEVIEVNGINVEGKTPGDVLSILTNAVLVFLFIFFDRKITKDHYIQQCSHLPMVSRPQQRIKDDAYWWQARKESERTARAGLIPSRALQERRILHERTQRDASDGESKNTTRPMRTGEVAGREYIFVTREKMDADIEAGKFIEHGEYKGHLYGTSAESVKSIVNAGCVCLLSPHFQAIKALRTVQLKPFLIHIKPPEFDELKRTRTEARAKSTFDESNARGFTDEEFQDMIKSAERIDFLYGHFFDDEIVNADLLAAFEKLVNIVQRIENEPLWAPSSWVQ
ncbi:hypothetical protein DOY81_013080, partial [Sarcophaga bullata]